MGALEFPQGLLGCGAVIAIRLHRIAKLGQCSLRGKNQMPAIDMPLSAQEIGDWVGRGRRGGVGSFPRPRGRNGAGGLRGRSIMFRGFWRG